MERIRVGGMEEDDLAWNTVERCMCGVRETMRWCAWWLKVHGWGTRKINSREGRWRDAWVGARRMRAHGGQLKGAPGRTNAPGGRGTGRRGRRVDALVRRKPYGDRADWRPLSQAMTRAGIGQPRWGRSGGV